MNELVQAVSTLLASGPRTHADILAAFPDESPSRVNKAIMRLARDEQVEWGENKTLRIVGTAAPSPAPVARRAITPAPRE